MPSDVMETPQRPEEDLRAEVRAVMEAEKATMPAISKEVGVAYSTLSAWMAGTYAGRTDRIAEQVQKWLAARQVQARTRALAPKAPEFLLTPTAETFFAGFEHAQFMPDMVVITGAPGVGKTSAARAWQARTPNVWVITGEPCYSTPRMLLDDLAETIGVSERYSSQKVSRAIVQRLRGSGGLIIMDEAQHLPSPALDQLRTIHDLAGIGIALVGNETVYTRLEGVGRTPAYAQLFSRVGMRLSRNRAQKRDVDMLLDAWKLGGEQERRLLQAIGRKPGALRQVTKVLRVSHMLASAENAEAVGETHIRMAWERLSSGADVGEAA